MVDTMSEIPPILATASFSPNSLNTEEDCLPVFRVDGFPSWDNPATTIEVAAAWQKIMYHTYVHFLFKLGAHVAGSEGHDGGGALVADEVVHDGRHRVDIGRRGGEVSAAEWGPQEGRHPVANSIE